MKEDIKNLKDEIANLKWLLTSVLEEYEDSMLSKKDLEEHNKTLRSIIEKLYIYNVAGRNKKHINKNRTGNTKDR